MDQEKIGNLIKEIRKDNNLTQKELADKLGVTFQAVSKWENGKNIPDIAILKQISDMFNINIDDILNGNKILQEKQRIKKRNVAIGLLITIVLVIAAVLVINHNHQIQFKKVTTCDSNIKVTGNVALDAKKNMYISITVLEYENEDKTVYKEIKSTLYESYNDKNTKIQDSDKVDKDTTLDNHLSNLKFNVGNYKTTCPDLSKSNLYIEVNATKENNEIVCYRIPLELEDLCEKEK